jgi:beta-galactosidase GanA
VKTIGVQYYRPPHPQRRHWAADLAAIKAHGMDAVRTWMYWRTTERTPGEFDWSDYDTFFDAAAQAGLRVVVQLVPEVQPAWFLDRHEALRPRSREGVVNPCLGNGMCTVGSYPGILFDQPVFQEASQRFFFAAAAHFRDHAALDMWDPWNEIMPHAGWFSFDAATAERWHRWLRERFGTIERFNALSAMAFERFEQIALFDGRAAANEAPSWLILRFHEFLDARAQAEMARRVAILRAADPRHPVYGHTNASMIAANNDWTLAREVDAYGTSQYCSEHVHGAGRDFLMAAMDYAAVRAAAPDRPWWLAEFSGGQLSYLYGHHQATAAEVRAHLVLAAGFGAEQAFFWQYRAESFGQESPGWGLTALDGEPDDRMAAVAGLAGVFARHRARFDAAKPEGAPVVILYDRTTEHLESAARAWVQPTVGMQDEMSGWFEVAYATGSQADLQRREGLEQLGVPPECRVYVLPMHLLSSPTGYAQILAWVERGGQLVLTPYSAHFDEDLWLCDQIPGPPFAEALDIRVRRRHYDKELLPGDAPWCILPHGFVEEVRHGAGVEVAARTGERPLLLTQAHGRGRIHYFTSLVGAAYRRHGGGLAGWLGALLGAPTPAARADGEAAILCRTAADSHGKLYYLVNPRHVAARIALAPPAPGSGAWLPLTDNCSLSATTDGGVQVGLPARDGAILSWQMPDGPLCPHAGNRKQHEENR